MNKTNLHLSLKTFYGKARSFFEHKHLKKIIGSNIALAVVATSAVPGNLGAVNIDKAVTPATKQVVPLTTNITGAHSPVRVIKMTQRYTFYHPGLDLDGKTGDEIKSIKGGVIEKVIFSKVGYGNHIFVNHGEGVVSLYAHLSKVLVNEGDSVSAEQVIGLMGSTGRSTGDHLHLEVRVNGKQVDPLKVIQ